MNGNTEETIRQLAQKMGNFERQLLLRMQEEDTSAEINIDERDIEIEPTQSIMPLPLDYDHSIPLDSFMDQ